MVGGGFSSKEGVGWSQATDIYNPQTRTFSAGPQLTTARAQSMAINAGGQIFVSGNWHADDPTMDYYDGASFRAVGQTDGRSRPYMFADRQGNLLVFSAYDVKGDSFGFYTFNDGSQALLADQYTVATGNTDYLALPFTPQLLPMNLPDDTRPADYHISQGGNNFYLILAKTPDGYCLSMMDMEELKIYVFSTFNIPTTDTAGQGITWRGGVLVSEARQEVYLIGASGPVSNQTLHVISLNYVTDEWTIASATGFKHNLLTASYTLLNDGRVACTGGGIKDNTDAQRNAYIISPSVAGQGDAEPDDNGDMVDRKFLVVETKDHVQTTYMLADKTQVLFAGDNLRVVSRKVDVIYKLSDILRFTYETRSVTGVNERRSEPAQLEYKDDQLVISGIKAGASVGVYSLDGKLVKQLTAHRTGTYRLSLASLPQGVYIVKADNITYKIMKR
jgi:DNA-binding beta-propeller fold protein YncE